MQPYDINTWFTPRFAINYFAREYKLHGNTVLKSDKYKKVREAWIMGVTLFGIMKLYGNQWWLQVPKEDPPDMFAMTLVPNTFKQWNEMHHREIEIMQITKHTNDTVVNEIMRKLRNKYYMPKTALVVYLNRTMHIDDMRILSNELIEANPKISDIWIMAVTSEDSENYIVFSLYPNVIPVTFNLNDEMGKLTPGDQLEMIGPKKSLDIVLEHNVPVKRFIP